MLICPLETQREREREQKLGQILFLSVVMTHESVSPSCRLYTPPFLGGAHKHGCHANEEMSRRVISVYGPICCAESLGVGRRLCVHFAYRTSSHPFHEAFVLSQGDFNKSLVSCLWTRLHEDLELISRVWEQVY